MDTGFDRVATVSAEEKEETNFFSLMFFLFTPEELFLGRVFSVNPSFSLPAMLKQPV